MGFAQGKTMLLRRADLARAGGIQALACEAAEDAAATKIIRGLGLRAALVDSPFGQPLGQRSARQIWGRQTRWAQLRRITFPGYFSAEVLTGIVLPLAAAAYAATAFDLPVAPVVAGLAAVWVASEAALAATAGWHLSWWSPLAWMVRDALLPAIWVHAWLTDSFEWRGSAIRPMASEAQAN